MKPIFRYDIKQNTEAWDKIRLGKITASTASCLLVGKDDELGAGALTYAREKAAEIIKGSSVKPFFSDEETERGHDLEPLARAKYEETYFVEVKNVGFVEKGEYVGCSPDGVVPNGNYGTEFKCFREDNHLNYIDLFDKLEKKEIVLYSDDRKIKSFLDKKKWAQIQFSLWVTKFDFWDLGFYNPYGFGKKELVCQRIYPDKKTIKIIEKKTDLLIKEIERLINLVK